MNYFSRLLTRSLNNTSVDIIPAITPDSIPEILINRSKSKSALNQTEDFVHFSTKDNDQASKVTAQPSSSPAKYTEKQKNSDLSEKEAETSLHDVQDILQPELNHVTTRLDDTPAAAATEQSASQLKEITIPKSKESFSSISLSSTSHRKTPFSQIKEKQTENDQPHHPNYQHQPAPDTNSNVIEKQNANIKYHHQTIDELDYFTKKIKSLVRGTRTQTSSLDEDENLLEQYQNLQHLLSLPHLQTDSLKQNDQKDFIISNKKPKGDSIVTDLASSNNRDEIFYPEVKNPVFPVTQGRSHNESKNQALHTIITINIERIEVRNSAASDSKPNLKMREKFSPPLSLGEYLKQRSQLRRKM
jgi:hypothetical protein